MTERTPTPAATSPSAQQPRIDARTLSLTGGVGLSTAVSPTVSTTPLAAEQDQTAAREAAASAAANTTADTYTVSLEQMMSIKDRIAKETPWVPNPLNDYLNYTYHFRLFMAPDYDFIKSLNEGDRQGEIKPGDVFRAIDNNPMRVIAESGVTAGFNIQEVKIESIVGPNMETRNTNATNFVIEIQEPLGTSLVENMRNAAIDLGIRNMDKAPYFLELTFMGYDVTGTSTTQVNAELPAGSARTLLADEYTNGGRWLYEIQITNIETELTASGSNYTLTALPYNEAAFDPAIGCVLSTMTISGTTVKEFLDSFKDALKDQWLKFYLIKDVHTFDFELHGKDGDDPNGYLLVSPDSTLEENKNDRWEEGVAVPTMSIPIGMEISSVIEAVLANTREVQNRAYLVLRKSEEQMTDEEAAASRENSTGITSVALYRSAQLFRVEPDIEIIGYNYFNNIYRKHITFHIWPFFTEAPVVSKTLAEAAKQPEVQSRLFHELIDRGFFRKKYDYIFTGNNTEITRLDIRYNLAWSAVLPILGGDFYSSSEDATTHARRADGEPEAIPTGQAGEDGVTPAPSGTPTSERAVAASGDLLAIEGQVAEKEREIRSLGEDDPGKERLQEELDALTRKRTEITRELRYNESKFGERARNNVLLEQEADSSRRSGADKAYLEDLDAPSPVSGSNDLPHKISFTRPHSQTSNMIGNGFASPVGGERGVYGAVLEQMYGPLTTGLINIDLEIRGDPYWLSYSNVERRLHFLGSPPPLTTAANMASYMQGDNVFMLEFSYPFDIKDDTGDVNIRYEASSDAQGRLNVDRIDKFTGMYRVVRATHTFSGGEFRQTLKAQRFPLLDLARAMSFDGIHAAGSLSTIDNNEARQSTNAAPANSGSGQASSTSRGATAQQRQSALANTLNPDMARVVARAQEISPVDFQIASARRTEAEQRQIVGRGNSRIMNSKHLTGNAVDIIVVKNGVRTYDNATSSDYQAISRAMYQAGRELNVPILWGGDFSNPANAASEQTHYEIRRGG